MQSNEAKRLLQTIYDAVDDEPICHANQEAIAGYVDAELQGEPVAEHYPDLHSQLATCATCRAVYTELKTLLSLEHTGQLVPPPIAGYFDFGYLPDATLSISTSSTWAETVNWRLDAMGRLIVALSVEFIRSLQPLTLQASHLKAPGRQSLFELTSPAVTDDLQVTLAARPTRADANRYSVTVMVEIPSRGGWPNLAGSQVVFKMRDPEAGDPKAGAQVVKTQTTDAFGKATYLGIDQAALSTLVIEITPLR